MQELVRVNEKVVGSETVQTVNARDLYEFLGSKRQFADWIKERIELYDFVQDVDFIQFHKNVNGSIKPLTEYFLTLDMAKELSMVERNEKGKQARLYFIECERRAKNPLAALEDPAAMRTLLLSYADKVVERDKLIGYIQPKAEALDRISQASGSMCITDAAKTLQVKPQELFSLLSKNRWIYKRSDGRRWVAYQDRLQQQVLEHKITTIDRTDGSKKVTERVLVTPKGLTRLAELVSVIA
jgi:phage anti-repressor protein/phage antirepressor YoqD-like protein